MKTSPLNIGYFGKEGSNTHHAASMMYRGNFRGFPSIQSLFHAVNEGMVNLGVAPIENSIEGSVGATNDQLYRDNLFITGEFYSRITHCLIGRPGSSRDSIRKVISHPQALGQCSQYLEKTGFEPIQFQDTASAVSSLSDPAYSGFAAIGSRSTAELYGMEVLEDDIGDYQDNHTRFITVSRDRYSGKEPETGMKASIVVSLDDSPGSLRSILDIYSRNGVNLTRIESRPVKFSPWKYIFFLDSVYGQEGRQVLLEIEKSSMSYKLLGIYPMARL